MRGGEFIFLNLVSTVVYLKRTFHPVGQGAFFTEQFYDADMKPIYNVVYDCGSKSTDIDQQMEYDIRNCFHERKKIDVLFLSHFDDDHVNKVGYLKKKGHLQGTRIFIPMVLDEKRLGIDPYSNNYDFILSLKEDGEDGIKVIQVRFDDEDAAANRVGREDVTVRTIESFAGGDVISSGTNVTPGVAGLKDIWRYALVNVRFKELIEEFKRRLKELDPPLDYDQLNEGNYVEENMDSLKKVYRKLGNKPKGGTAINLNSLLVMSYPRDPKSCSLVSNRNLRIRYTYFRYRARFGYAGSCLYTGDTSANETSVWDRIEQMIAQCLAAEMLILMQVPHHGSKYSYDDKLVNSYKFLNGFVNYDPYYGQHIFDDDLPMKLAIRKKSLIQVTWEYASQFEECWRVG